MKSHFFAGQSSRHILFLLFLACPIAYATPAPLTQDAFVNAQPHRASSTLGSRTLIKVSPEYPRHGLLQFDLAGIDDNVTSAMLTFSVAKVNSPDSIGIHAVLNAWDEATVTFNSSPSFNPAPASTVVVASGDVGGTVSIDIALLAQIWVSNPGNNHGLALISQGANVEIRSKEGGVGATLEVVTGGTGSSDNVVVVAPEGGDYTNPLDAAENAFDGDQWCHFGCVMIVRAGSYQIARTLNLISPVDDDAITLIGAGSDTTSIITGPDVDIAIVGTNLSSLQLIHTSSFNGEKIGWASISATEQEGHDLRIQVSGGTVNYGVQSPPGSLDDVVNLSDVRITVVGGESIGIYGRTVLLKDAEVRTSSNGVATSVFQFELDGGDVSIEDSVISALGSPGTAVWSSGSTATIADSLLAVGGESAKGLAVSGLGVQLKLSSSTIEASGPGSVGVSGIPADHFTSFEIDQSKVFGETAVLLGNQGDRDPLFRIGNSTLDGAQRALAVQDFGRVRIDHSILVAPVAIDAQDGFNVEVGASKVDGAVNPSTASLTCVYAYDGAYHALDENCL